jgi:hypothetical protein
MKDINKENIKKNLEFLIINAHWLGGGKFSADTYKGVYSYQTLASDILTSDKEYHRIMGGLCEKISTYPTIVELGYEIKKEYFVTDTERLHILTDIINELTKNYSSQSETFLGRISNVKKTLSILSEYLFIIKKKKEKLYQKYNNFSIEEMTEMVKKNPFELFNFNVSNCTEELVKEACISANKNGISNEFDEEYKRYEIFKNSSEPYRAEELEGKKNL